MIMFTNEYRTMLDIAALLSNAPKIDFENAL